MYLVYKYCLFICFVSFLFVDVSLPVSLASLSLSLDKRWIKIECLFLRVG